MNSKVKVRSINQNNEIEWQKEFQATEMKNAKAKATKWINKTLCTDEITVEKEEFTPHYQIWRIR